MSNPLNSRNTKNYKLKTKSFFFWIFQQKSDCYPCMSLYMQWPLRNFYTFIHLVYSNRKTISKWTVGFRYGNFTLKLARGKKKQPCLLWSYGPWVSSLGLIFGGGEISIPETRPIRKSYSILFL